MSQPVREPSRTASDVARDGGLGHDARKLLRDGQPAGEYFQLLVGQGLSRDAVRFVAQLLSKQAAVWWGCLCAWDATRPDLPRGQAEALRAAVRWVLQPSEENRRAAEAPGRAAGAATPAGALALAAFWSGGSMSRPDLPVAAPPHFLSGRTVAAAVLTAAALGDPARADQRLREFLALAVNVEARPNH